MMSEQDFKRFLNDLDADAALRGAVEALRPDGREGSEVPADALLALARKRGYDIDADDIAPKVAELEESDLENVAAGAVRKTGIRVAGISGESSDASHGKWIDVLSLRGSDDWR